MKYVVTLDTFVTYEIEAEDSEEAVDIAYELINDTLVGEHDWDYSVDALEV